MSERVRDSDRDREIEIERADDLRQRSTREWRDKEGERERESE